MEQRRNGYAGQVMKRLEILEERWKWFGTALRVQKRFNEVHGSYLASSITLAAFISLFPLLLVAIAVVGFLASGGTDVAGEVVSQLGLNGDAAEMVTDTVARAEDSKGAASLIGLVGLMWTGLGLVAALSFALDSVWQVTGRGMKDKAFGLMWLAGATLIVVASVATTTLLRWLPGPVKPFSIVASLGVGLALWLWTFKVLPNRDVGWKPLLPGAVLATVGLEVLKIVGGIYVPRAVASSSAIYGSIGTVFAVLAWLLIFGRLVVYSATLNVVRWEEDNGTVTVEIDVPKLPGEVPVSASRAGEAQPLEGTTAKEALT